MSVPVTTAAPTAPTNSAPVDAAQLNASLQTFGNLLTGLMDRFAAPPVAPPAAAAAADPDDDPVYNKPQKLQWDEFLAEMFDCSPAESGVNKDGNKRQYRNMWAMRNRLVELEAALSASPDFAPGVPQSFLDLKALVAEQMRLIRMADKSKHGWGAVSVFEANPLLRNPREERRFAMAESTRQRDRPRPSASAPYPFVSRGSPSPFRSVGRTAGAPGYQAPGRGPSVDRPCSNCGSPEHWNKQCRAPKRPRYL